MAMEVKIPIPDQVTEEVRIVKWHKGKGDAITKGEIILEVETDKSVIEVEALGSGVLLGQLCSEDDMIPVGQVVGMIGEPGEKMETPAAEGSAPKASEAKKTEVKTVAPSEPTEATSEATQAGIKASPVAKKLAQKLGVNLSEVTGSGPGGRIVKEDVESFAAVGAEPADVAVRIEGGRIKASPNAKRLSKELAVDLAKIQGTGPEGRTVGADVEKYASSKPATAAAAAPAKGPVAGTEVPLTKMRRAIGINLQKSFRDTPHFNVTMSIDMSQAIEFRGEINKGRSKDQRISVNDLVLKGCAVALKEYPAVNSRLEEDKIVYLAEINIGVATAIADGLVVPVLTGADGRSWDQMSQETKRLAQQARLGKIIGGGKGTFTVSNLGMFGVHNFTAIINPPESAILAVGAVKNEVIDIGGGIGIRPMMKATLCSDHRVVDGALAAEFLRRVKIYLEEEIS